MSSYSSSVGLGPAKLLPITGTFALPFTAYFLYLSLRCVQYRLRDEHWIGDDSSKKESDSPSGKAAAPKTTSSSYNDLQVATRAHANFVENVPLAFLLAGVAELNGANRKMLAGAYSTLFALRVLHADFGLLSAGSMARGRPVGYFGTCALMGALAGYSAWLVEDYWL